MVKSLADQVTKSWEAYGDKGVVFYQHLEPLDKAQESLGLLIAQQATNTNQVLQLETTVEFLTSFLKSVFKARVKMEKYIRLKPIKKENVAFAKRLDEIIASILAGKHRGIPLSDYVDIIFRIGLLYDSLGYNSPERLRIKTPVQSDIQLPGMERPEEMEMEPDVQGIFEEG